MNDRVRFPAFYIVYGTRCTTSRTNTIRARWFASCSAPLQYRRDCFFVLFSFSFLFTTVNFSKTSYRGVCDGRISLAKNYLFNIWKKKKKKKEFLVQRDVFVRAEPKRSAAKNLAKK